MAKIYVNNNFNRLILGEERAEVPSIEIGAYTTGATSPDVTITSFRENYSVISGEVDPLVTINGEIRATRPGITGITTIHLIVPVPRHGIEGTSPQGPVNVTSHIVDNVSLFFLPRLPTEPHNRLEIVITTTPAFVGSAQITYHLTYFSRH